MYEDGEKEAITELYKDLRRQLDAEAERQANLREQKAVLDSMQ